MAAAWRSHIRTVALYLFSRYPFINALTLLMLLGERATREEHPPIDPKVIYSHLGVFLLVGIGMGFNLRRKDCALIHTGQLFYLAFSLYTNNKLNYSDTVRMKMCLKTVGVAGFFLLYAFFTMPKPRSAQLRRLGETIVGCYLLCSLFIVMQYKDEKEVFLANVPGGYVVLFVYALLMAACALCYIPGLYVNDVSWILVILLLIDNLFVESNIHFWTKRRGMDFWLQIRMIADNTAIIFGVIIYLTCTKKKTYDNAKAEKVD